MILSQRFQYNLFSFISKIKGNTENVPNVSLYYSFKSKFPRAKVLRWHRVDVVKWQVKFSLKKNDFYGLFDNQGNCLETTTVLSLNFTPKLVQENFKCKYNLDGLQMIYHIKTENSEIFEIQWSNGVFAWKLLYDISGKIIGKLAV